MSGQWSTGLDRLLVQVCVCVCVCACTHLPVLSFLTLKEGNALKTPAVEYLQLSGQCWMLYPKHQLYIWVRSLLSTKIAKPLTSKRSPRVVSFLGEQHILKENSSLDRARDPVSSITFNVGGLFSRPHLQCCQNCLDFRG